MKVDKENRKAYYSPQPTISQIVESAYDFRVNLPLYPQQAGLIYLGLVTEETWSVVPHYHDHFELCSIDEGRGWFAVNDLLFHVRKGDLFLTRPDEIHQGAAAGDAPFRLYYLGFRLEGISTLITGYYQPGVQSLAVDQKQQVGQLFEAMLDELRNQRSYAAVMIQSLFSQLLITVLRSYENLPGREGMLSPALMRVLDYLHGSVGLHHTVSELASVAHLSRSHLAREFKRQMGESIGQYMHHLCLERAKYYLRESDDSVTEIARCLHFPSIHPFSRFFKHQTGLTPQEYRQNQRGRGQQEKVK
jgi:AraC-like DNA-binding protein/mannose-6-phosphate isomerase-like protein (cupin superfamily)